MKGSLNKGLFTYLFLFLGLIVAVALVLACILLFSPGTEIFGLTFVSYKNVYKIKTLDGDDKVLYVDGNGNQVEYSQNPTYLNMQSLYKLKITANNFDIAVKTGDLSFIEIEDNISAFSKAKDAHDTTVTKHYNALTNTFEIVINDTNYSLKFKNNRVVNIFLNEEDYSYLNLDLTTKNGNISLGGSDSIEFKNHKIASVKANVENGDIVLSKYINFNDILGVVELHTNKGNVTLSDDLENNMLKLLDVKVGDGKLTSGNLQALTFNLEGANINGEIGNVTGDLNLKTKAGVLNIGNVTGNIADVDEKVENVKLTTGIVTGSVTIAKATGADLTFEAVLKEVLIKTEDGNVTIKNLGGKADITTTSGDVSLLVSETNVKHVVVNSEKGDVKLFLQTINGDNLINTKGNVTVNYKEGLVFKLVVKAKKTEFKNENIVKEDQTVTGYPGVNDSEVVTSNNLTVNSEKTVTVNKSATIKWN